MTKAVYKKSLFSNKKKGSFVVVVL